MFSHFNFCQLQTPLRPHIKVLFLFKMDKASYIGKGVNFWSSVKFKMTQKRAQSHFSCLYSAHPASSFFETLLEMLLYRQGDYHRGQALTYQILGTVALISWWWRLSSALLCVETRGWTWSIPESEAPRGGEGPSLQGRLSWRGRAPAASLEGGLHDPALMAAGGASSSPGHRGGSFSATLEYSVRSLAICSGRGDVTPHPARDAKRRTDRWLSERANHKPISSVQSRVTGCQFPSKNNLFLA